MLGDPAHYHPDGLQAAKARATAGRCLFCAEQLTYPGDRPTPRARIICGSTDCGRAYQRAYGFDRRAGAPLVYSGARSVVRWHCGCGRNYCHAFFRANHRHRCLFAAQAWPVVVVPARRAA